MHFKMNCFTIVIPATCFVIVASVPVPCPGGALQTTSYSANYTSEGNLSPCATISGSHIVTQNCHESNLTNALQDFLRTVCTVVNAAGNGPDQKRLDVNVSSNLTYIPPTFTTDLCHDVGIADVPPTISQGYANELAEQQLHQDEPEPHEE